MKDFLLFILFIVLAYIAFRMYSEQGFAFPDFFGGTATTTSGTTTPTYAEIKSPSTAISAPTPHSEATASPEIRTYSSSAHALTFWYPSVYFLREQDSGTVESRAHSIVLVEDTKSNRDILDGVGAVASEGPTSITIAVYQNPKKLSAQEWAKVDSNWNLGTKTTVSIGGMEGISYTWDGLYLGKTSVVANGGRIYVFTVTWIAPTDRILNDFAALLHSVVFSQ